MMSYIKSSQSFVLFLSGPTVSPPTTSVRNNVTSKSITCGDSITQCPGKCLCKSSIVKNKNVVNFVNESINNVVNCSYSTSMSSRGFYLFQKYVHKCIS